MYISLWENYRGHPDNISFMQFSTKIDGFEQKDSQGFENSYNSYEQYPLEKFLIFTIYQNYTLALSIVRNLAHTDARIIRTTALAVYSFEYLMVTIHNRYFLSTFYWWSSYFSGATWPFFQYTVSTKFKIPNVKKYHEAVATPPPPPPNHLATLLSEVVDAKQLWYFFFQYTVSTKFQFPNVKKYHEAVKKYHEVVATPSPPPPPPESSGYATVRSCRCETTVIFFPKFNVHDIE